MSHLRFPHRNAVFPVVLHDVALNLSQPRIWHHHDGISTQGGLVDKASSKVLSSAPSSAQARANEDRGAKRRRHLQHLVIGRYRNALRVLFSDLSRSLSEECSELGSHKVSIL